MQNDDDPTDDQAGAGTGTGTGTDTDPEPRAASRPKRTTAQQVSNNAVRACQAVTAWMRATRGKS